MAQITVTYTGFDDMVAMAKALIAQVEGDVYVKAAEPPAQASPVAQTQAPAAPAAATTAAAMQAPITQPAAPAQAQQAPTPPSVTPMQTPPAAQVAPAVAPVVPTTSRSYTREDLQLAAAPLMDAGKFNELQNLLRQFNATSLIDLPADQYGAFATALRGIGASI